MKRSYQIFTVILGILLAATASAQEDTSKIKSLEEVVVTGQYKPQSVKKSVYQVRVLNTERIQQSGATNVQQVLNNQVGFRFSTDNTLGTSDVQLMGMSGRNVKILLDGVPMVDRGDTRESLNQVDINSIERIEIVEGPMSVSYGSDALAGVINIITKKYERENLVITARVQEETAGTEYHPFSYKGVHQQNININYRKNYWSLLAGGSHNDFNGFGGDQYGRGKTWRPKEQWLANARIGYDRGPLSVYYRIDGLDETITNRSPINYSNYKAIDQRYFTNRIMHQVQGSYNFSDRLQLATVIGYTDYKRRTKTTRHDFEKDTDELTTGDGEQDVAKFKSFVFRPTLQYRISDKLILQPGIDINSEQASGQRIVGTPVITDYAAFISAEIKPASTINIRPGLRFINNSAYKAPPVIPSINTKIGLSKQLDLRLAYAYGFRSPALRELYFEFIDANHNIVGNPNLKAESSNSFNGSFNWSPAQANSLVKSISLGGFYNQFRNQIDFALSSPTSNQYTYFNVNNTKTAGAIAESKFVRKNIDATLGLSYIGVSRKLFDEKDYVKETSQDFFWSPELSAGIMYHVPVIHTKFNLFYKLTGKRPQLVTGKNASGQAILTVSETNSFQLADFISSTRINKYIDVTAGVKNIFDVTNVNNSAPDNGSIHNTGASIAVGYGRSYFVGLNVKWTKK